MLGEPRENFFASRSQVQDHLPAVAPGALSPQELPFFEAVHQLHDAVMPQLQTLGEFPDAGLAACRKSSQSQHEHVLLRLETRVAGRFLAPVQVNSDPVPEFGQRAKFRRSQAGGHELIISLSDINSSVNFGVVLS